MTEDGVSPRKTLLEVPKVGVRMGEVEKLCDVIGIIHNGSLLAEGTPTQLREKYQEKDLEEIFVKIVTAHVAPRVAVEVS